jgi:hypothetical protein
MAGSRLEDLRQFFKTAGYIEPTKETLVQIVDEMLKEKVPAQLPDEEVVRIAERITSSDEFKATAKVNEKFTLTLDTVEKALQGVPTSEVVHNAVRNAIGAHNQGHLTEGRTRAIVAEVVGDLRDAGEEHANSSHLNPDQVTAVTRLLAPEGEDSFDERVERVVVDTVRTDVVRDGLNRVMISDAPEDRDVQMVMKRRLNGGPRMPLWVPKVAIMSAAIALLAFGIGLRAVSKNPQIVDTLTPQVAAMRSEVKHAGGKLADDAPFSNIVAEKIRLDVERRIAAEKIGDQVKREVAAIKPATPPVQVNVPQVPAPRTEGPTTNVVVQPPVPTPPTQVTVTTPSAPALPAVTPNPFAELSKQLRSGMKSQP